MVVGRSKLVVAVGGCIESDDCRFTGTVVGGSGMVGGLLGTVDGGAERWTEEQNGGKVCKLLGAPERTC